MSNELAPVVLIVEDHPANMELASDLLMVAGCRVLQATDAKAGIALARDARPDVILMDVGLPGMNGLEATRILKAAPATSHIPVIAATSHAMRGDEERARDAGCDGYMAKPFDTRGFAAKIISCVRGPTTCEDETAGSSEC